MGGFGHVMGILSRFGFSVAAVTFGALVFLVACSNQGEGARCDHLASNGGNDDCQNGLVCTPSSSLNGAGYDACCPQDRTQATTSVCSLSMATGIDASVTTPDSAVDSFVAPTPDAATPEAAPMVDAPVDSPVDSPATVDAPSDGASG